MSIHEPDPTTEMSLAQLSEVLGVGPHVVTYWLVEFADVGFVAHDGLFSVEAVRLARLIHRFLHEEYFTLRGARQLLRKVISSDFSVALSAEAVMFPQSEANGPGTESVESRLQAAEARKSALQEVAGLLLVIHRELANNRSVAQPG